MNDLTNIENQIGQVTSFDALVQTPFKGNTNAMCWQRELIGDFEEIVNKVAQNGNITELGLSELLELDLTPAGQSAREIIINDLNLLTAKGADPTLNVIKFYERDDSMSFFPTDVYSFHVDRSPVPTDTYLCTYHGASSEIVSNSEAVQKILIPELRTKLKNLYHGHEDGFEDFLTEYFFDLHYEAKPGAKILSLGQGHIWKLAIDHPDSKVTPSLHRAPKENKGQSRLLLIC
jgi:hypothetical protein